MKFFIEWESTFVIMVRFETFYRLLYALIVQDLRGRWSGGVLTWAWALIQPLAQIGLYGVVFGSLMIPRGISFPTPGAYLVYLCSGIFCWLAISESLIRGATSLLEGGHILRSRPLPLIIFPLKAVGSAWVLGLIGLIGSLIVAPLAGIQIGWSWLLLPVPVVSLLLTTAGAAMLLAPLTVLIRDTQQVVHLCLPLAFWATPIVYEPAILPIWAQHIQRFNPLVPAITGIHEMILNGNVPELGWWAAVSVVPSFSLAVGWLTLKQLSVEVRDVI